MIKIYGELSSIYWLITEDGCDLTVVPLEGRKREMYYDDTDLVFVQPSQKIPYESSKGS